MTKINNVINKGRTKVMQMAFQLVHGDSHFVAIVVAIIVCIFLAGIFRGKVETFITDIIDSATSEANGLF